jgi:hypothetical protein
MPRKLRPDSILANHTNKNDFPDAEAIAEAIDHQNMRFVPIKRRISIVHHSGNSLPLVSGNRSTLSAINM